MRCLAMIEAIGELDYVLSRLIIMSRNIDDEVNWHTMKHHAEDMAGAAEKILKNLQKTKERHPEWDANYAKDQAVAVAKKELSAAEKEEIDQAP